MSERVIVVGAGFGGLSAAMALTARGFDVTVIEAGDRVGGKAGVAEVDGVTFDTGPSLLTLPHVVDSAFQAAGERLEDHLVLRRLAPAFRYHWPDGVVLDVHHELPRTLESVTHALGSGAARQLRSFADYAATIWNAAAPHFVYGDAPSVGGLFKIDFRSLLSMRSLDALTSMSRAIRKRVREPHLRDLLMRYATYNGSDPRKAPATLNCIAHVELALGGYGVQGGLHAVAQAMAAVAERRGASIELGARVAAIEVRGGAARGVRLSDGRRLDADAVVCNAEAAHLFDALLPDRAGAAAGEPSTSGWTAVFRSRRGERPAHTVIFPERYEAEFEDLFDHGRVPTTPTVYACDQAVAHGRAGWDQGDPLFVMVNAPALPATREAPDWQALGDQVRGALAAVALIDPADPIVWERTPLGLARRFPGSQGSIYGTSSNSPLAAFRRPANRVPGIGSLYLATGSGHPGGGVPLCVLSGLAAARALLADRRLAAEGAAGPLRAAV